MADPKVIGSTNPVTENIATFTRGIGFPLLEVEGDAVSTAAEVLVAESFVDQVPVALDTPIQVNFGPAAGTPSDPVSLDANGLVTINQAGTYLWNISLYPARTTTPGTAFLFFRALKNSVQDGNPLGIELTDNATTIPVLLGGAISGEAGDTYTLEFVRDSAGQNDGTLKSLATTTVGWGSTPSARIRIRTL